MSKYTDEDIQNYASRDIVIGSRGGNDGIGGRLDNYTRTAYSRELTPMEIVTYSTGATWSLDSSESLLVYNNDKCLDVFSHSDRIIGLIVNDNDDGSNEIALLSNGTIQHKNAVNRFLRVTNRNTTKTIDNKKYSDYIGNIVWSESILSASGYARGFCNKITLDESFDYNVNIYDTDVIAFGLGTTTRYNGIIQESMNTSYTLNTDLDTTLYIGVPITHSFGVPNKGFEDLYLDDYSLNMQGNFYDLCYNINLMFSHYNNVLVTDNIYELADSLNVVNDGRFAFFQKPYNLILTKSLSQAINYLNNGTIPSDAIIYPMDIDNLSKTDGDISGGDSETGGDDTTNNEDGTPKRETEDTLTVIPSLTPQQISNNNLYWLQAGELENFIRWFWTEAGEIIDAMDLINKIQGLYNDLASAIINIRYMPIMPEWVGGLSSSLGIIVGQIIKEGNVSLIGRGKPIVRSLGTVNIAEEYKAFTDYNPYCDISLYLPYHGFIDIDTNVVMNYSIEIECIYDIISGTIQYLIYCIDTHKYLINSCIAKMAVDIPITLQSKSDRDSAIFNNVSNAVGNIMSASASIATKNPIGLIMSTTGLASSGTESAPLNLKGTVGEQGSFYASPYPAIYIKRPTYNRPSIYASRVGYPANKNFKIDNLSGYFTVYNPTITFKQDVKPLESEVQEIYELLEKGVIK